MMKRLGCLVLCLVLLLTIARSESSVGAYLSDRGLDLGHSRVHWPELGGTWSVAEDTSPEEVAAAVNARLMEAAQASRLTAALPAAMSGDSRIDAGYEATLGDGLLCVVFLREQMQKDVLTESVRTPLVMDLRDGNERPLDALFTDPAAGKSRIEEILTEEVAPQLSGYLASADLLPLPETWGFSPAGVTLYYPPEQFTLLSGRPGAVTIAWTELSDVLDLTEDSLPRRAGAVGCLEENLRDLLSEAGETGSLPGIPVRLGDSMAETVSRYRLLADPDFYENGRYVELEDSRFRGVMLMTDRLSGDDFDGSLVRGIRADRFGAMGLITGQTTLETWRSALGEPDATVQLDENQADAMRLPPGTSDYYRTGEGMPQLRLHADTDGILRAVFLLP